MKYLYDLQYSHSAKAHFELIHDPTATGFCKAFDSKKGKTYDMG